ncbi:MAG TPA: efflux RND transporter periplasmic adaptor subunit [Cellvibrionaceae bacterium]
MKTSTLAAGVILMASFPSLAQDAIQVEGVQITPQPLIERVPLTGSVSADKIARISTQVQGLVRQLHVDAGDTVEAGDMLLSLDTDLASIAHDRAQAEANRAREQWRESQRRQREAQTLAEGSIATTEIQSRESQARIDEALFEAADAERQSLAAQLERHQVRAPFTGTVSSKLTEVGEWVGPGDALLELVASEPLRLDFQVPQRHYPAINHKTRIRLTFDAYPEQSFMGQMYRKVPLSRAGARTFLLRATLAEDNAPAVIPGMSTSGTLLIDTGREGLSVPRDALIRYPDGRISVWVAKSDNFDGETTVSEQLVTTGLTVNGKVEISEGLTPGAVVITRGNEALQQGQTVRLTRDSANSTKHANSGD